MFENYADHGIAARHGYRENVFTWVVSSPWAHTALESVRVAPVVSWLSEIKRFRSQARSRLRTIRQKQQTNQVGKERKAE
jgi:hypothetical protein